MEGHGPMEPARAGPGRRIQLPGLCTLCPLEVSVWQPSRLCPLVTRTPSAGLLSLWPTLLAACRNLNHIQVLCGFFFVFCFFFKKSPVYTWRSQDRQDGFSLGGLESQRAFSLILLASLSAFSPTQANGVWGTLLQWLTANLGLGRGGHGPFKGCLEKPPKLRNHWCGAWKYFLEAIHALSVCSLPLCSPLCVVV